MLLLPSRGDTRPWSGVNVLDLGVTSPFRDDAELLGPVPSNGEAPRLRNLGVRDRALEGRSESLVAMETEALVIVGTCGGSEECCVTLGDSVNV